MNTMNSMFVRSFVIASVLLGVFVTSSALAQNDMFSFGPPLRSKILFSYKYTERLKSTVREEKNGKADSSERIVTYYVKQYQTPVEGSDGLWTIEGYIDSMKLEYRSLHDHVIFNTQDQATITQEAINHPEVLAPSSLVSRPVRFTITPYGQVIKTDGKMIKDLQQQVEDPNVDNFTRDRVLAVTDDNYMSTVYFPWRNVVPLGRDVAMNKPLSIPMVASLDRIVFQDTAQIMIVRPNNAEKAHLQYSAQLKNPISETFTVMPISQPLTVTGGNAMVTGDLELDGDGVVLSGVSGTKGEIHGLHGTREITVHYDHEVYIEMMGMESLVSN